MPKIKIFPELKISKKDRLNIMKISVFEYKKVHKETEIEASLITSINLFAKLAFKKYKLIKIAFFPILVFVKLIDWSLHSKSKW